MDQSPLVTIVAAAEVVSIVTDRSFADADGEQAPAAG